MRRLAFLAVLLAGCPKPAGAPVSALGHHEIKISELPAPRETRVSNGPKVIARPAGAKLTMPPGFSATVVAEGFDTPRWIVRAPSGDLFVSDAGANAIYVLRDKERFTFATGLNLPFGMAFAGDALFVANTDGVVRFRYASGQTAADGPPQRVASLPGQGYNQHWTRNVVTDGSKLWVSVGSETNVEVEPPPRASVLEMNLDGSGLRTLANGTRNPVGLAIHPETGRLWAAVQERDLLGDDLVPDYVTELKDGAFYGWPYSYLGAHVDPRRSGERPDLVAQAVVPDVLFQAHSAPLGLVFYDGAMFPADYKGDAIVALHGSWNRSKRTGYQLARVRMKAGRPLGGYDDFCVGWMLGEDRAEVWGRPVGLAVAKDGALMVVDDGANVVWRIAYAP